MKKTIKNIWKIARYPFLYLMIQFIITLLYTFILGVIIGIEEASSGIFLTSEESIEIIQARTDHRIIVIVSVMIFFLIMFPQFKKEWKKENFWSFGTVKPIYILLYLIFGISFNTVVVGIMNMLPTMPQQPTDGMIGNNLILEIIAIGLLAPIVEEIIYRGIVQKRLTKMLKVPVALVLQALIFAVIHFHLVQGTYAFIFGIIVGLIYIWSGSIWSAIVVHIAFNSMSVIMTNILGDTEINLVYLGIAAVAGLAISIVCMVVLAKKRVIVDNIDEEIEVEKELVTDENV